MKKAGHTQIEIANVLKRHPSIISRELSRNTGRRGYRPDQAQSLADGRHAINARRIDNANGLVRQYFPKDRDFTTITQQEIDMVMERLNNRPGKRLGYRTPAQVFFKSGVAFQS